MRRARRTGLIRLVAAFLAGRVKLDVLVVKVAGRLGIGALVLVMVVVAAAQTWWGGLSEVQQVGAVVLAVALPLLWAQIRSGRGFPTLWHRPRGQVGGPLVRTIAPWYSVYVITEWRDGMGTVLPRTLPGEPAPKNGVRHLVYVGKANTLDDRMESHMRERPWFHDHLMFSVVRCGSEQSALSTEARLIEQAARSLRPHEWPRENDMLNPHYRTAGERKRRAFLLERARQSPALARPAVTA